MIMEKITKKTRYSYIVYYHLSNRSARVHSHFGGPFDSKDVREEVLDFAVDLVNQVGGELVQVRRIEEICYTSDEK